MTKGELKNKIDDCLINGIINIAKDLTITNKAEQIRYLIFNYITDDYWDTCNDDDVLSQMRGEPVSEELHTAYTKVKEKKLSDKALDFIVETQEENDYICEQMVEGAGDYCVNNCQNLNRHCVKLFLEKVYKKNKQAKKS